MFTYILSQLKIVIFTISFFIIVPLGIIIFTPVYIFRFILYLLKPFLRPDLDKFIHVRSSVLSCDKFETVPDWNLVIWLTHEDVLSLEKYRREFYSEYVLQRDSSGNLKYPEYQQHYETWCGFQFWRWEDNFDIREHIRYYDGKYSNEKVVTDRILLQIIKELTYKPWPPGKSPWEFLQIPNYRMDNDPYSDIQKSILIFRLHHGFGDGYYILKVLMEDICGVKLKDALGKPKYFKRNIFQKIQLAILFWARIPYDFMKLIVTAADSNAWRKDEENVVKPMVAALTPHIKLELIKDIKDRYGCSFSAVIMAAIAGGLRNMMIQKGVQVPEDFHTGLPVPMPNHPDKLCNHFIFSFLSLPLNLANPVERLMQMDKNINDLKKSTAPSTCFAMVPLFGALTRKIMIPLIRNRMSTTLISNFPGVPIIPNFKGVRLLDMMFGAGLGPGHTLGFMLISHTDHIRLLSSADPTILCSDQEVEQLNEKILREIATFKALAPRPKPF